MKRKQITTRAAYLTAHKNYDELHGLLGGLTGKLADVSKNVDKEFLASYRVHMLSIQSEIKSLREDVDKGVQALKSDGNVAKLELEVNWFVEECTRLRLHYTTMENDCLQMQARFKAMVEQKTYMNEQLKAILKRNRVLEAEIDHALKFNQKIKSNDGPQDAQTWKESEERSGGGGMQRTGAGDNGQTTDTIGFEEEEEDEALPDSYYHEQLRRQTQSSPLSTANFVPVPSGRTRGSRSNSKANSRGSSRGSNRSNRSRSRSRSASPSSPHRTASINPNTFQSARVDMADALDTFDAARYDDYAPSPGPGDGQFDQQPQVPVSQSQRASQKVSQPGAAESLQGEPAEGANRRSTKSLPKVQPVPSATLRAQAKHRQRSQQLAKQQLIDFLKHKSPGEASLERAIADIFEEVRLRKLHAAKRGSVKRLGVNFMGKDLGPGDAADGAGMSRKRSGRAGANPSLGQEVSRNSAGRASSPVMPGSALGRRLGMTAALAADDGSLGDAAQPQEQSATAEGLLLGSAGAAIGATEVDLLGQPLIQVTGGLSGLGAEQLSDNDRFSCMVKFLLDFDRFKEVVEKLQAGLQ